MIEKEKRPKEDKRFHGLEHDLQTDDEFAMELFRKIQELNPERARELQALSLAFIDGKYPGIPPADQTRIKFAFLAGMAADEYIKEIQSLEKGLFGDPPQAA